MPGPKSFAPRPVTPSISKKRFTVAQANRTLPLVKRIVSDIVRMHDKAVELQTQIEIDNNAKDQAVTQTSLDQAVERLQNYVGELTDVGCELKDYEMGLVDFTGRHQGRDVLLCWKLGEDKIGYWHELNAGFANRKPVALLDQNA